MKCYFLRHGIAVEANAWDGSDAQRPLTDEGIERMHREAAALARLDLGLDAILTSPLVRARQTAEILADVIDARDRLTEDRRLGLGFDRKSLGAMLEQHAGADAILLVGHEPSMSSTIGAFVGGARIVLKKGGVACVDVTDTSIPEGELVWLATPKVLLVS